jgi:hypothetical protein
LAERYSADRAYEPGTVLIFGGSEEVTESYNLGDPAVAGVVSTKPAYLMNSGQTGCYLVDIALVGRVPCRVVGKISKGDRLISSWMRGVATAADPNNIVPGTIIGKSMENYDSNTSGIIEIAVGRS